MRTILRIRWDNVGLLVLSALLAVYGVMIENYYALAWQAVAMGLAVALLKERALCTQARLVAIHFAEKNGLFDKDKKNGNTTTQP
jgi:hypothetical protein